MINNIYPWLRSDWQRVANAFDRLPHALLLTGPNGLGKMDFALALARRMLCRTPSAGWACGTCAACNWFAAGNHPDFRMIVPEADANAESESDDAGVSTGGRRGPSRQIRIDQIRDLWDFVTIGSHGGNAKVIVLRPAEAMNHHTANALLKLLEEPPASVYFIIISHEPQRLLPTIRSRCRRIQFFRPDPITSVEWLRQSGVERAEEAHALTGGIPLAAAMLSQTAALDAWTQLTGELARGADLDPVALAGKCEGWLKIRGGEGIELRMLVDWVRKWVCDLARMSAKVPPRFHPRLEAGLAGLAQRRPALDWVRCYNELHEFARSADHPLNPRLFLEDLFIRYADAAGQKS